MDTRELIDYCLSKKGAYVDFPFGDDSLLIKAAGHYFATFFLLKGRNSMSLKCEREDGRFLKETVEGVDERAWHCPAVQQPFNLTVDLDTLTDERTLKAMIDESYAYNYKKLTKKERASLEND